MIKALIFSAPSGAGKSTVVSHLLKSFPDLSFSVSATTRSPRLHEVNGVHYYFISKADFQERAYSGEFLEWEEVYPGLYYGSLRSEVERLHAEGKTVLFDVDVQGGIALKKQLGDEAISVFVQAPDVSALKSRLEARGKESTTDIEMRVSKADEEMGYRTAFDVILINDDLALCLEEAEKLYEAFIGHSPER